MAMKREIYMKVYMKLVSCKIMCGMKKIKTTEQMTNE